MRHCGSVAALAAILVLGAPACLGDDGTLPTQRVVLVSGLDDHFMPETREVPLHSRPGGPVVDMVPAGSLVRALEIRGEWVRVAPLESHEHAGGQPGGGHRHGAGEGWVADYYLRGRMHAIAPGDPACPVPAFAEPGGATEEPLPPSAQVEFVTVLHDGARLWVLVRTVIDPVRETWLQRTSLSEHSGAQLAGRLGHVHRGAGPPPPVESTRRC